MFDMDLAWDRPARTGSQSTSHTIRVRLMPRAPKGIGSGMPVRMAVALDISGSMMGQKLIQAKRACESVMNLLRPEDRFWLAGFSTELVPIVEDLPGSSDSTSAAIRALDRIVASGVTRTDVAMQWIEKSLPENPDVLRIGIVITDGHPTDALGRHDIDTTPFAQMASRMGQAGISLCAVGLGNAEAFNTALLTKISDLGRGTFLYADTPSGLEQVLASRLSTSQTMTLSSAILDVKPLLPGIAMKAACRYRPEYLPLEGLQNGDELHIEVGALRGDMPTDILISVEAPAPGAEFGWDTGTHDAIEVRLSAGKSSGPLASEIASLVSTASYAEAQRRNSEVEEDRLRWEVNLYTDALLKVQEPAGDADPRRTGQLLVKIEQSARRAGDEKLAGEVAAEIDHLRQTGKLDAHRATGLLTASRSLGANEPSSPGAEPLDSRRTGTLSAPLEGSKQS